MLKNSASRLIDGFDAAVFDLDGVVYVGADAVPRAPEYLQRVHDTGIKWAFITNNASRPPNQVSEKLVSLGVPATQTDVVNSAQAAAHLLAQKLPGASKVYVIGGAGLEEALAEFGLRPVTEPEDGIAAVAQGYGPDMPWRQVLQGVLLVASGLPWVATNTDMTIPLANGIGPGNGALVKLVADFTGRVPLVAGKPAPALFAETQARLAAERPLMVGDRLDTDISGAREVGWASLLVLTGVSGINELVSATPDLRPDYLGIDLGCLLEEHHAPQQISAEWCLGGWRGSVQDNQIRISGTGQPADWWRVLAHTSWQHLDTTGTCVDLSALHEPWIG